MMGALVTEIQIVIKVLLASHWIEKQDGEIVDNLRDSYNIWL